MNSDRWLSYLPKFGMNVVTQSSLSVSLSFWLAVSQCFSVYLILCLIVFLSLWLSVSCLFVFLSLWLYVSLSLSLYLTLSFFVDLWQYLCHRFLQHFMLNQPWNYHPRYRARTNISLNPKQTHQSFGINRDIYLSLSLSKYLFLLICLSLSQSVFLCLSVYTQIYSRFSI